MSELLWWGYLHTNGSIQVKRYFDPLDIQEAINSPFVKNVTQQAFSASDRNDAITKAKNIMIKVK